MILLGMLAGFTILYLLTLFANRIGTILLGGT